MKKRIFSLLLALCLLSGNCLTVFADETEPASQESTAEAMTTETQEQTQPQPILEEPAPIQPETQPQSPVSPQTEPTAPVLTPDSLSIDMDRQYPGMDKTYRAGYSGTVSDGKLRLVLPLLNQSDLSTPINVTLSAAFLTAEEKKASITSQNLDLGNGQIVEKVYVQCPLCGFRLRPGTLQYRLYWHYGGGNLQKYQGGAMTIVEGRFH